MKGSLVVLSLMVVCLALMAWSGRHYPVVSTVSTMLLIGVSGVGLFILTRKGR